MKVGRMVRYGYALGFALLVGNYVAWGAYEVGSAIPTVVGALAAVAAAAVVLAVVR